MEGGPGAAGGDVSSSPAAKDAEIAALAAQNAVFSTRVAELEGLVAALRAQLGWDSSNSGRPQSSDSPFVKKPAPKRSSRTRSGKSRGKQHGAPGATLRLVDDPDETVVHEPPACRGCGNPLHGAEVFGARRHQVFDTPPVPPRPYVTEHRVVARTCGGCGTTTEGPTQGVPAGRVQYGPRVSAQAAWLSCAHFLPVRRARSVLNALSGFEVSDGWVAGGRGDAARLLEQQFLPQVRGLIAAAPVAHADETTARADGGLRYLHVAATEHLTAMHVEGRTKDDIDAAGVWPSFTGVLVRDGYAGYEHLDRVEHPWCGIHLVRDLRSVHDPDPDGQTWADAMVTTLLAANDTAHTARAQGRTTLTEPEPEHDPVPLRRGARRRVRREPGRPRPPAPGGQETPAPLQATSRHDPALRGEPRGALHQQHRRVARAVGQGPAADLGRLLAHHRGPDRLRRRAVLPVHRRQVGHRHPRRHDPAVHHRRLDPHRPHPRPARSSLTRRLHGHLS